MTSDPLLPILRTAAELLLSRPMLAGQEHDAERFVTERRQLLLDALLQVRGLRDQVRARVQIRRDQPELRALTTLVLSPDDDVVQAGLRVALQLSRERLARQNLRRRHQDKLNQLRSRLEMAKGRHDHAAVALQNATSALADVENRAEELDTQVAALQRRLHDPRAIASSLLAVLQQTPEAADEGPEARDPRNLKRQTANEPAPLVLQAAKAAGIEPQALITALQMIVAPPTLVSASPRVTVTRERHLRVRPLGGATEIGGSCVLVEAGHTRLLVDAGLRPGDPALPPRGMDEALSGPIDAVVVTHAHIDHCGYIPALVELVPEVRILATPETAQLMPRMWADSAKLMSERERVNRRWGVDSDALYGREAVETASQNCEEVPLGVRRKIGDISVELFPAGHILGAAGVVVQAGGQRVVVTGDISGFRQETVDGYSIPDSALDADLLVMESTCCAEDHSTREIRVKDLVRAVEEVYSAGGRVLIPAFALGRAQELAMIMTRHLPHVPVLVDGMAADITASFERITIDRASPLRILGGNVSRAKRPDDLDLFTSGVVITTSGMLSGGPAVEWATRILPEARSALFLSGYQDEESGGAKLLRLVEEQASHLVLHDRGVEKSVPLNARVQMMRLSAHADKRGLLEIADEVGARNVMLVHGIRNRQRDFAKVLAVRGHEVVSDRWGDA
ncbi:MBL fold metallo-hydrolase [Planotetraspora sp. A-T 1434]|uniref:MBL fold metallo-hydrolase n=1 Tax=Planotetraspora sp. A-T 1434 TaxID=2979219 RepID=UPI0021C06396|nr:MBL fold metallo-hydrolase [Planotetraspora sp. A-T 1434]MCT9934550.1 MBL fold metallo-hydrolase [Planotetraspora sp. A-T 1434]